MVRSRVSIARSTVCGMHRRAPCRDRYVRCRFWTVFMNECNGLAQFAGLVSSAEVPCFTDVAAYDFPTRDRVCNMPRFGEVGDFSGGCKYSDKY